MRDLLQRRLSRRALFLAAALVAARGGAATAIAGVVVTPYSMNGANDTVAVAAAAFAGWYATGDSFQDRIEIRDVRGNVRGAITRSDILALAPWMNLDGGPDGPCGLGFSASGRLLYILVHDDTLPADGQPSDVLLRYDLSTDTLTRQARLELFDRGDVWPHLAVVHHRQYVYVGTGTGQVKAYLASSAAGGSTPSGTWTLPGATIVHGLAIDRDVGVLYAASDTAIFRATIPASPATAPTFTQIAMGADIRGLAWGDHYGGVAQRGLYILSGAGPVSSKIEFVDATAAGSGTGITPAAYATNPDLWHGVAFTADGRLFVGAAEDAAMLSDSSDTRLGFDAWMRDELAQATRFARGLISPDGEPDGWVIDGDVLPGGTRFHPATPDGAGWAVCLLLMNEAINADPLARQDISRILTRYAGLSPDGIRPVRSADGIYKHWLDPLTGNTKGTWPDEYATLSTMFMVTAAARAADRYPNDPAIAQAATRIIFQIGNLGAYVQQYSMAFKGLPGTGPDASSWAGGYHEGVIFAEQSGVYGGPPALTNAALWLNRAHWPSTATYVPGKPLTVAAPGQFQPAFLSIYPAILSAPFRADASATGWRTQIDNLRWTSAAWTDDNGPRYYTVFSAGTSPSGYNADTLTNHPGNLATFTSLLGLSAFGQTAEAVGGYAAYRKGARQLFKTGASILYRGPYDGTSFVPNSAGLPDVALGALGLAELIQPGSIDLLLARPYPTHIPCPADFNGDGGPSVADIFEFLNVWFAGDVRADFDSSGGLTVQDIFDFLNAWFSGC
ncbi:MAG TPA: GC-type dockerin domain-anchored protein [Phycisphaerales bacterium]|nr:GC-type dockerin domain-anchored protein [Phycisphaerales bacterium]